MAKSGIKRAPAKRRANKAKALTRGLTPAECHLDMLSGEAEEVRERVKKAGGEVNCKLQKDQLIEDATFVPRASPRLRGYSTARATPTCDRSGLPLACFAGLRR